MKSRSLILFFFLLFGAPFAYSGGLPECAPAARQLAGSAPTKQNVSAPPAKIAFDFDASAEALARWKLTLSASSGAERDVAILKAIKEHPSLESQVALFDAIQGEGPLLSEALKQLRDSQSVETVGKKFLWPWARAPGATLKWGGVFRRSPTRLALYFPHKAPKAMSEVRDNLLFLAKAVREAEVAELRQRSPIRSLPFGSSNASYPKQVIDVVENSAKRDYAFVHEWNQHFEEPLVLPADTIPKFQWWKAGLRFPFLLAWPTYDPLKRYHLTAQGRDLWLAEKEQPGGLRQHLWSTFGSRASFNYGASTLRNIYFGMAIASASFGVVKATTFLLSSDRRIAQEEATSLLKKITEPETSKKILQKYHERPGGSPAVNNFFDQENVKLREHIRQHGDPDGTLTEEILENEELRDALKN